MTAITDAQNLAIYNSEGAALPASLNSTPNAGSIGVQTIVSATPFQISATRSSYVYINITTAASLTISMGPEAAGTSIALNAAESDTLGLISLHVPAGWYVKVTGTVADLTVTAILN